MFQYSSTLEYIYRKHSIHSRYANEHKIINFCYNGYEVLLNSKHHIYREAEVKMNCFLFNNTNKSQQLFYYIERII